MKRNFWKLGRITAALVIGGASLWCVVGSSAHAQAPVTHSSKDSYSDASGYHDMSLQALLRGIGVGSNVYSGSDPLLTTPSDQLTDRAFRTISGDRAPEIEVLFDYSTRKAAAGYQPYHHIGWYVPTGVAPDASAVYDTVYDTDGGKNAKLKSTATDFKGLDGKVWFALQLTSPGKNDTPIYSEDNLNDKNFRNIAMVQERDLKGVLVPNSYIVAWEDLRGGGDSDFNDIVVRLKYVQLVNASTGVPTAVPEPGIFVTAATLFGSVGMGMLRGKSRRKTHGAA